MPRCLEIRKNAKKKIEEKKNVWQTNVFAGMNSFNVYIDVLILCVIVLDLFIIIMIGLATKRVEVVKPRVTAEDMGLLIQGVQD